MFYDWPLKYVNRTHARLSTLGEFRGTGTGLCPATWCKERQLATAPDKVWIVSDKRTSVRPYITHEHRALPVRRSIRDQTRRVTPIALSSSST